MTTWEILGYCLAGLLGLCGLGALMLVGLIIWVFKSIEHDPNF